MPIVYRCKNCGYVFHYLEKVGQDYVGIPSVLEVLGKYGYICPKCKSKLSLPSNEDVIITSLTNARNKNMLPIKIGNSYYIPMSILGNSIEKSAMEEADR